MHTLAVTLEGEVWVWGANPAGQLAVKSGKLSSTKTKT